MFIQYIAYHADDLTHRKRGEDRSDSKTFDMTEETESQSRGHGEAGHVEGDLDFGVWNIQNIAISLGKRSVGMIGSPQRLERAIPRQMTR